MESIGADTLRLKSVLQKDILNLVARAFEERYQEKMAEFLEKVSKSMDQTNKTEGDELKDPNDKPIKDWIVEPIISIGEAIKSQEQAPQMLVELLANLKGKTSVKAKLALTDALNNPTKEVDTIKEAITKDAQRLADTVMTNLIFSLDQSSGFSANCVLRRWTHLNQSYNYQNGLNSLLIMVSEPTFLFGFSQYFTTDAAFNVKFRLVEGELALANPPVQEFDYVIRSQNQGQPERTVEGIAERTFPVFLKKPVRLKANTWYNISFEKPVQSHHIYYGSGPLQAGGEAFTFADGAKRVNFRRAADDTIDNGPTLGQFPDLYLK